MTTRNRLAIFVDGASMFFAQKELGWFIDWKKFYNYFGLNRDLSGAFYFTATPPVSQADRIRQYRSFKRFLQFSGYRVIDKEVKVFQDPSGQVKLKGNLDIELVFRMLVTVHSYDEVLLAGGDSDYVAILDHLTNLGKVVKVVGLKGSTSIDLINASNSFIDLVGLRVDIARTDRIPSLQEVEAKQK